MSYLPYILTFLLVLSPVLVPATISTFHAIRRWRPRPLPTLRPVQSARAELAVEFD